MMTYGNFTGFGVLIAILCGLAFLALLVATIVLVIWLVRRSNKSSLATPDVLSPAQAALNIAQERYARGEITREQYQQIVADLSQKQNIG
jgi:putative membrane protein